MGWTCSASREIRVRIEFCIGSQVKRPRARPKSRWIEVGRADLFTGFN